MKENCSVRRCVGLLLGGAVLLCFPGCGKTTDKDKVYPVSGTVLVQGKPAEGARVTFYRADEGANRPGMAIPSGEVDSSGVYHLQAYLPGDGAPAGDYRVAVTWLEPVPAGVKPETITRQDRLGGRYADPSKSKLTAKVESGGGEIPAFDLK
ncbi:MAG TPA: carboxypeptidase-like regulatory domain-containing protein [Lacipirellulaceae bacterium]|nr:carboxypeptidase-like regulatory domain-containing protein [Lacipirellulaceae bacterium]